MSRKRHFAFHCKNVPGGFCHAPKKPARADRFDAVQAAAIEWLQDQPGPFQESARVVWHERFAGHFSSSTCDTGPEIDDLLELSTFFTEIRQRPELREALWPQPKNPDFREAFRERELRAQLLAMLLGWGIASSTSMS